MNKTLKIKIVTISLTCLLVSCASTKNTPEKENLSIEKSFLSGDKTITGESDQILVDESAKRERGVHKLTSIERDNVLFQSSQLALDFSDGKLVNVTANNMKIADFIHYVYGELLDVNYLLSPAVSSVNANVTLNLKENISQRRLFILAESVLSDRGLKLKLNEGVYLISKLDPQSKSATVIGMGRTIDTIPSSNRQILQIVPILYGIKVSLKTTVEQLADVSINIDVKQSALFVNGDFNNVSRAIELIQLLDSPANRGRHIGLVKLTYSTPELYLQQISQLLETEGVPNSVNDPSNNNLVFVPLTQIGAVAVFSATRELMERVEYWTDILDKPAEGDVKQYFVFHPKYARAQDIGESLTPLISAKVSADAKISAEALSNKNDTKGNSTGQLVKASRKTGASNDSLTFVVDARSNALIFYTSGTAYRNIIPLINRLDVLPKQVMLDIVVAEVSLTDQFKHGVKWAIQNGAIGDIAGRATKSTFDGGFSFIFDNGKGDNITATLSQTDSHVKILSNPNILVRDGVTASLDIGTDIAITDAVTEGFNNSDRVTTSTSYRKTGIKVSVTPTINAQGVVIMDIEESISNEVTTEAGSSGSTGNPSIFERNLTTAVVADSGQTIILGGLIEERKTVNDNKVPFFGDIPLFGHLFKSSNDEVKKTELILMVTPRVISRTDQWDGIMSSFQKKLGDININQ